MTVITVISTFTAISPEGKVDLEDCSVRSRTIAEIKNEIYQKTGIDHDRQSLWWHGYLLDNDGQTIKDACVGVNKGESLDAGVEKLVLFLTVPIEKRVKPTSSRVRSVSFDNFKNDIARRGKAVGGSCIVL